ncbi:DUF4214 domain-containing protein [Gemmata sp.]|uniref:DUF4214 domain-containing protein n=1 Tax=Gemmata sp. TaxID=1914242 RepID=UPI003F70835B
MNIIRWLNSLNARRSAASRPSPRVPGLRGWEQLEDRVVPSAASDAFVAKLYTDLFDRAATASEVAAWSRLFDAGTTDQRQTALDLQGSAEYRNNLVTEIFQTALGRAPDAASLNFYVEQLRTVSAERVEAAVLGSAEFFQRFGGTNTGFVAGLYKVALERNPDAAGVSYFVRALDSGTSREDVALQLLTSTEHHVRSVYGAYERFLGRGPEAAGLQNWVEFLGDGGSVRGLIAGVAAAPEYTAAPAPPAPPASGVTVTPPATQSNPNGATVSGVAVTATGTGTGSGPIIYSAANLPPGLTINPLTGVIGGTIAANGSNNSPYNVRVTATQGAQTGTANFTWVVPTSATSTLPFSLTDAGWITLPSGVRYKDVTVGTGATAAVGSNITVGYNGYLTNGMQFDSGTLTNRPLEDLIPGWNDAIPGMKVGGVRLLDIPSSRGYGTAGFGTSIPGNAELAFRVELRGVS